jgi:hypothetical protein
MDSLRLVSGGIARGFYVLDEKREPTPATEEEWRAFPKEKRLVAETKLGWTDVVIATEFHGADYGDEEGPLLFVTSSIIDDEGGEDGYYATWREAEAGHREVVSEYQGRIEQAMNPLPLFPEMQPNGVRQLLDALHAETAFG